MHIVSNAYKQAMKEFIRGRAYITVSIGVVSQEAQASAVASGDFTDFTTQQTLFKLREDFNEYASYEQNFWKADGTQLFKPRNTDLYENTGLVTSNILGNVRVSFDNAYNIRGLTLKFGTAYPTEFKIVTSNGDEHTYTNDASEFSTDTPFGDIEWFEIQPLSMIGGEQRLHIHEILCGIGLVFTNDEVETMQRNESLSSISDELPNKSFTVTVFDNDNMFNVEDNNSFINFLEQKQIVSCSIGMTLADGTIEWVNLGYTYLVDWQSSKGKMQFTCSDLLAQMDDEYILGNKIYTRTAYQEAENILQDMGFEPDEYILDEYLNDITLTNPMPEGRHSECLQLLANACRCVMFQDSQGRVNIQSNFARVIAPEDIAIASSDEAEWSHKRNILTNAEITYAELTQNYYKVNDTMYLLPDDANYLPDTGYVSAEISDSSGYFSTNPYVDFTFEENHRFYSFVCTFGGNPPKEIQIKTYNAGNEVDTVTFTNLDNDNLLFYNFKPFDNCRVEIIKTEPNNRVVINRFLFGELTDYSLVKDCMLENPVGYKEQVTQSVAVKVYTFEEDEQGKVKEVEDDVWITNTINPIGVNKRVENPLINTEEMAQELAEWLGDYYNNNIFYDVKYRGEPRIEAMDIIRMDSDVLNNLQVEVMSSELTFNGAFGGSLSLHKVTSNT